MTFQRLTAISLRMRVFGNRWKTPKYTDSPGVLKLGCRIKKELVLVEIEDFLPGVPVTA